MNIGIIGLGRLGGALARGLDRFWMGGELFGYTRSRGKAEAVTAEAPRLTLLDSAAEVFERCEIVFLWMKPADGMAVLEACADGIKRANPLVVACTTGTEYGRYCPRWTESLPNVNMCAGAGVTLLHFAPDLGEPDRRALLEVLGAVGTVHELPREEITYYSALASCGPALYATMMEDFADTLATRRGYDREFCRALVRETMAGTIATLEEDGLDASALVERVAHPGGASEAGTRVLKARLPALYVEMLSDMKKY
jgi:competence protein ComER